MYNSSQISGQLAAGKEKRGEMCGNACKGEVKEEDWGNWEEGVGRKELGNWGIQEKLKLCRLCKL